MYAEKQKNIQKHLFNKLFFRFSTIKGKNININKIGRITRVYYSKEDKKWFTRIENNNKYFYFFGSANTEEKINPENYDLCIDFSKKYENCDDCIGIIYEDEIYLHKDNLIKIYSNLDLSNFEIKKLMFFGKNIEKKEVISLGLNNIDFIKNINMLIDEIEKLPMNDENKTIIHSKINNENKDEKKCNICGRLLKNNEKNICKTCKRKQYAVKILEKLLPSIKPGIPFKQDDLKILNLNELQIKDYIWTLQEFDLITKNNSKYIIKDIEILKKFAYDCNLELKIKENSKNSLNKTCKTCGKTFEKSNFFKSDISEDGYEDNCKKCKKRINSAIFLKELLKYVKWEESFTEQDLLPYFNDQFALKANIWNLLENNIIKTDFDSNTYKLINKEEGQKFIDKYYKEEKIIINKTNTLNATNNKKNNEKDIVLNAISRGRTRKEAAIIAGIRLYKITHWFNEGRQGFGEENINFYIKLKDIEKKVKPYSVIEIKTQINSFMDAFKENKDITKACEQSTVNKIDINDWIILSENDISPYSTFSTELKNIKENNTENTEEEKYISQTKDEIKIQNDIIELIKNGFTIETAAKEYENGSFEKTILKWYENGKIGDERYKHFYEKCNQYKINFFDLIQEGMNIKLACQKANLDFNEIKQKILTKEEVFYKKFVEALILNKIGDYPEISQKNKFGNESIMKLMNKILKLLIEGKSSKEACEIVDFPYDTYKYWINRGRQNVGEIYVNFYNEITKINEIKRDIGNDLNKYLTEEYDESNDFTEEEPQITKKSSIYDKYKDLLKPNTDYRGAGNKTGFAWTNKMGKKWRYSKNINKETIVFSDENIYKLYEKVINAKHIWGVIDQKKAIKTLKNSTKPSDDWNLNEFLKKYGEIISKESTLKETNPKNTAVSNNLDESISKDILKPLPKKFKGKFKKPSTTGFAWVTKSLNKWAYTRNFDGKIISFRHYTIYELYKEVIENNLTWGVRDYDKAMNILTSENPDITIENTEVKPTINTDNEVIVTYFSKNEFNINILIKGLIGSNDLFNVLSKLKLFENNITRILTNKLNNNIDLLIEMNLELNLLSKFEKEISELRWQII